MTKSLKCPSRYTKKKYSQFLRFDGRLSSWVRLIFSSLKTPRAAYRAPARSTVLKTSEVLSLPVTVEVACEITKNRVVLFGLSWTARSRTFRLYTSAAVALESEPAVGSL